MRLSSSVEKDLFTNFLPVLLAVIFGILLISVIALVVIKGKQNSGPLKQLYGQVIDKTPCNVGESWIIIQSSDGQRLRLRANNARHPLCIGDRGIFEYRSETLNKFTPQR